MGVKTNNYVAKTGGTMTGTLTMGATAAWDPATGNITTTGTVDGIDVSAHAVATTGVHGAGASYLALASGSQYTAVNKAGDTMTGALNITVSGVNGIGLVVTSPDNQTEIRLVSDSRTWTMGVGGTGGGAYSTKFFLYDEGGVWPAFRWILETSGNVTMFGALAGCTDIQLPLSAPASPVAGSSYFTTADNKLHIYNGTAWKAVTLA